MVTVSSLSGSSASASSSNTLTIGLSPQLSVARQITTEPTSRTLTAKQGAEAVSKALDGATKEFAALSDLQAQIRAATRSGATLSADDAKAINAKIKAVADELDKQAAGAKTGDANLLSDKQSSVTIATASGLRVNVAAQALDSKALGIRDLDVTDADSLRKATARIAQAVGQTQLAAFRLQTADGATGAPAPANPGSAAYDKISASQSATPAPGSAQASLEKALANQAAANAINYGSSGTYGTTSGTPSILSLFT